MSRRHREKASRKYGQRSVGLLGGLQVWGWTIYNDGERYCRGWAATYNGFPFPRLFLVDGFHVQSRCDQLVDTFIMKSFITAVSLLAGSVSAQVGAYGQCGGENYSGSTSCTSGYFCTSYNPYYYQCIPGK